MYYSKSVPPSALVNRVYLHKNFISVIQVEIPTNPNSTEVRENVVKKSRAEEVSLRRVAQAVAWVEIKIATWSK